MKYKYYFFPLESNNGKSEKLKTLEGTILYFNQKDKVNINSKMAFIYYDGNYFYDAYSNQVLDMKLNNGNISINNTNYSKKVLEVSDDKFFFEFCVLEKYKDFLKNILSEFIIHEQNVYKQERVSNLTNYADNNRTNIVNNFTVDNYKDKTGYYLFPLYKIEQPKSGRGSRITMQIRENTNSNNELTLSHLLVYRDGDIFKEVFSDCNLNIICKLIGTINNDFDYNHEYRIKNTYYRGDSQDIKKINFIEFTEIFNTYLPYKDALPNFVKKYLSDLNDYFVKNEKHLFEYNKREFFSFKLKKDETRSRMSTPQSPNEYRIIVREKELFIPAKAFTEMLVYKEGSRYYEFFTGKDLDIIKTGGIGDPHNINGTFYSIDGHFEYYLEDEHLDKLSSSEFKNRINLIKEYETKYVEGIENYLRTIKNRFKYSIIDKVETKRRNEYLKNNPPKVKQDSSISDLIERQRRKNND